MTSNTLVHFKKATGSVEISEPDGALTLGDRRLWNHLLAHAYPRLTKDEMDPGYETGGDARVLLL